MDHHIREYFNQSSDEGPHGNFHSIIVLHEDNKISWNDIHKKAPQLLRGWFELARLSLKDRIEFTRDYWSSKLPYHPSMSQFLDRFFASLDDIGIFITQKKVDDPYEVNMVYSLKGNRGFYKGNPPISERNQNDLTKFFSEVILPQDYLAFLQIHDGFCKATDCTGLIKSFDMPQAYMGLQNLIQQHDPMITSKGNMVNPQTLIPFYESFGMPFYQCFWAEWYPDQEMGNVYYSPEAKNISDVYAPDESSAKMAFPTFIDWLIFYLERVE